MSDTRAADPPAQQPGRPGQPGQPGQPADPYRWLENADDPAVREWTEKQEAAYRAAADGWRSRAGARERLRVLLDRVGTPSAPRPAGDRLFLARCRPGGELPELVVVEPDGTERVLVDPALVDPSGSTTLEEFEPSWDGRLLSYQLAPGGTENAVLLVLDVDSGRLLDPPIDRVRRSTVAWLPDSSGFYYVRRLRAEDQYHRRVRLHLLGTDPDTDPVVFGAGREGTQHYTVRISPDGRLLAVSAGAGTARRRDLWLADLTGAPPEAPRWRPVQQDLDARTVLRPRRGPLCHLVTDLDAPRGRLVTTTADRPTPDTWRDLIPQDPHAVLEDFAVLEGADLDRPLLLVVRTRHAVSEATVHDLADGRELTRLPLPPCSTVGRLRVAAQDAHEAWFTCTGFATPTTVLRYDARTGELTPWQEPSGAAAPSAGTAGTAGTGTNTVQTTFTSRDGTPVRMFVLSPTGAPDRPRPTLLTGYGGFGQSLTPVYSPEALAWVQAGGVYAVANLRGGGEEGEEWHRAGTLDRKQNTFDDFHAAADHLVDAGWTTPSASASGAPPTAACWWAPRSPSARRAARRRPAWRRCWTWPATSSPDSGPAGSASTAARPTLGNSPPCSPTPPTTTSAPTPPTPPSCSPSSTATAGSTPCTPARCARPCNTPPPAPAPSCSASNAAPATAPAPPPAWPTSTRTCSPSSRSNWGCRCRGRAVRVS